MRVASSVIAVGEDPFSKGSDGRELKEGSRQNQWQLHSTSRCSFLLNDIFHSCPSVLMSHNEIIIFLELD